MTKYFAAMDLNMVVSHLLEVVKLYDLEQSFVSYLLEVVKLYDLEQSFADLYFF